MLQLPHCASINKLPEHDLLTYCFSLNAKNRHLKRQLIHSSVRGFAALDEFSEVWLGAESNRRHVDFQSTALPTELPSLFTYGEHRSFRLRQILVLTFC